jgi:hypothetical protein
VSASVDDEVEIDIVEVPLPGEEIVAGLNEAVAPAGSPEADSEIPLEKPPETAVVIWLLAPPPAVTESDVGDAEIVKSGWAAVDETVTVFVVVFDPPEFETVSETV